jgi:hypothetical protein
MPTPGGGVGSGGPTADFVDPAILSVNGGAPADAFPSQQAYTVAA